MMNGREEEKEEEEEERGSGICLIRRTKIDCTTAACEAFLLSHVSRQMTRYTRGRVIEEGRIDRWSFLSRCYHFLPVSRRFSVIARSASIRAIRRRISFGN